MNPTGNNLTLICYDITNDKLRNRINKTMKDYGIRLQYSVFICRLDSDSLISCKDSLMKILSHHRENKEPGDSIIILEHLHPAHVTCLLTPDNNREIGHALLKNTLAYAFI